MRRYSRAILFLSTRTGAAGGAAGDGGVVGPGLEHGLLVIGVDGALLAGQQAGAHLDAAGPKGKGGSQPAGRQRCRRRR